MKTHAQQHQSVTTRQALPMQQQQKGAKAPTPPPPAAPMATQSAAEVQQAKRDTQNQNAAKKGFASTVLAGETGGYGANPSSGGAGKSTVLGG
jgi:hypothetical protein